MKDTIMKLLTVLCLFYIVNNATAQEIDYKGFPEWAWHKQDSTEYFLYTPLNIKKGERYPMVLFLHGCCGENYHATLRNTIDPPIRMWHNFGANTQRIPTYLIAPKTSVGWSQHIENLKKVMDELIANGQGDSQRIYITGFSMGGAGTWEFLERYPDYFAAALPMGMDFSGDPEKIKHVPVWTNKGETDWFARSLNKQVTVLRTLNGDPYDLDANWVTGVNPLFTEFKGVGHGVQWIAASSQDLVGWAYTKINDGNKYPNVYFKTPGYRQKFIEGEEVKVSINANDPDGNIERIEMYLNGQLHTTLNNSPFIASFKAGRGDNKLEAKAFDNKGKFSTATTWIKTDIKTEITTTNLPVATQGAYYEIQLSALGNGEIKFELSGSGKLPKGLVLSSNGIVKGIPQETGSYNLIIKVGDEDKGDEQTKEFVLQVNAKQADEVIVSNVKNYRGEEFPQAKVKLGESLWRNSDGEINFSDVSNYFGLTFIQGDASDTSNVAEYISFHIDEPAKIYVAYERKDKMFKSEIPDWLKEFQKEPGKQIVAQYFYYDVYSKSFPKGVVTLPDAYEKANGVNTNYFVMVKKEGTPKGKRKP